MLKKIFSVLLVVVVGMTCVFAEDAWWVGRQISGFDVSGIENVSSLKVNDLLYSYRGSEYSDDLLYEIEGKLDEIEGVASIQAGVVKNDDDSIRLVITITEKPVIGKIAIAGNDRLKTSAITDAITEISEGAFADPDDKTPFDKTKEAIAALYSSKGFESVPVEYRTELTEDGKINVFFTVQEGTQSRITQIVYEGNEQVKESVLKKQVKSKAKSLFNKGFLNSETLANDDSLIMAYYQTLGYIDAIVTHTITEAEETDDTYRDVVITFKIDEGEKWYFGGMTVKGNTIFSDEDIAEVITMKEGAVLNLANVQADYSAIADLYYDTGYISNGLDVSEDRDDTKMTVSYTLTITEGKQAVIEQILIKGLKKTQEYVMRRELEMKEGDIFSKAKLVTSAQNLYNTGLLSDLNYNLYYGKDENSVIIEFTLEEGSHMDVQFGATFGGSATGFPVSGFLQWADHNLGGRGQEFDISTTLSPDTQSLSVTFGDDWFANKRWANSISASFSHTVYDNQLMKGEGSDMYDGRNEVYPFGYHDYSTWRNLGIYPSSEYLMQYHLLTASLGYNTGYTFIYDVGRLSFNAGITGSLNKALYDDLYTPYERLIQKYHSGEGGIFGWQMSNKLNLGLQWDGRDFTINTTKGYVLSASATYAGGIFKGLSNYIKLNGTAAGYLKLAELGPEEKRNNLMLCATTNVSAMLPQYYNHEDYGKDWHDPKLGATKYEMLYIDGMTIARGHDTRLDLSFMWDNMLEVSYPVIKDMLQAEAFVSATGVNDTLKLKNGNDWYFSAGAGVKLKIPGFPLGLYLTKTAQHLNGQSFEFLEGSIFHSSKRAGSGMSLVLAISTSLI